MIRLPKSILLISLFTILACTDKKEHKTQPNVLFITVDDLNDWVGCLNGHPDTKTPNIDALAREGVLFTNAHCAAPLCGPSRIAMHTGKFPSSTGFYVNGQLNFRKHIKNIKTLPQYFKENGYYTLGSGKLYPDTRKGEKLSFDEYQHIDTTKVANINHYKYNNGPKDRFKNWVLDGGPLDIEDDKMVDGYTSGWIAKQLQTRSFDKPFFMTLGIFRPHIDWFVPRKYFEKFDPETIDLAVTKKDDLFDVPVIAKEIAICTNDANQLKYDAQLKQATAAYLASVNFADAMIGNVLNALKESKYADNTIVVLSSDHGWHLGEKQHWRKFTLWQEATRVPLIFKIPKGLKNVKTNVPTSLVDLYPTLVDLCGLPKNIENEGTSLSMVLKGKQTKKDPVLVSYGKGNHAIKGEKFTYIKYNDGSEELYDNIEDPYQWNNIANKNIVAAVKNGLKAFLPKHNAANQPKNNGSTNIELWHKTFDHIKGQKIEFLDW
ncbi:sulfatase [Flavobacteriaceae bacterium]|nr:sulfatase [Flavobacteriaceae bacterium]